uniref:Uncharacterized protein n=1 Tax=Babesia bovis TaxID=5865 RepID=S6B3M1_BABBO|nr:hypothetical protein [Babesia bovis]
MCNTFATEHVIYNSNGRVEAEAEAVCQRSPMNKYSVFNGDHNMCCIYFSFVVVFDAIQSFYDQQDSSVLRQYHIVRSTTSLVRSAVASYLCHTVEKQFT